MSAKTQKIQMSKLKKFQKNRFFGLNSALNHFFRCKCNVKRGESSLISKKPQVFKVYSTLNVEAFILTLLTWFDLLNVRKLECETKKSKMWVWTVKKLRITNCQKFNSMNVTFESFDLRIKKTSVFDYSLNVRHYVFFGFWTKSLLKYSISHF